ncbi:OB-fold domain-containing protein [Roseomonas sp. CAU 1739]|uniref:Zn-ribbon domain-containing OB-fold protein n=1 Tax=Roseomonas sp. CAU 1739 TaxID=3140364 RepID=UPI00325B17D6
MTTLAADLPQPQESPINAPMLAAWRDEGALALQRCEVCDRTVFYPRPMCPHCHAMRLVWTRVSGTGRIVSYSRIHRGLPPVFRADAPIVLAEIALAEGSLMIARVITSGEVHTGMPVRLVPPREAGRYPLPTFEPA